MIVPVLACTLSSAAVPRNRPASVPLRPARGSASSRIGHHGCGARRLHDRPQLPCRSGVAATQARSVVGRPRERHAERSERVECRRRAARHRSPSAGLAPMSFTSMSAIWLSLTCSISRTSSATVADSNDASAVPSTAVGAYDGRARDGDAARGERGAEAVGVRERGIGEERRVGAPTVAIDHQCRQRPGVRRDLPVLPTGGAARAVVPRLVDEQRPGDLRDAVRPHLGGELGRASAGRSTRSVGSPPGTITRSPEGASFTSVARRASGPRTASAPIAVSSFWFDAGASATSGSRVSTSPSPSIHTETDAAFGAMRASAANASSAAARSRRHRRRGRLPERRIGPARREDGQVERGGGRRRCGARGRRRRRGGRRPRGVGPVGRACVRRRAPGRGEGDQQPRSPRRTATRGTLLRTVDATALRRPDERGARGVYLRRWFDRHRKWATAG